MDFHQSLQDLRDEFTAELEDVHARLMSELEQFSLSFVKSDQIDAVNLKVSEEEVRSSLQNEICQEIERSWQEALSTLTSSSDCSGMQSYGCGDANNVSLPSSEFGGSESGCSLFGKALAKQLSTLSYQVEEAVHSVRSTDNIVPSKGDEVTPSTGDFNMKALDKRLDALRVELRTHLDEASVHSIQADARFDTLRAELRTHLDEAEHSIQPEGNIIPSVVDLDVKTLDARFDAQLRTHLDEASCSLQSTGNMIPSTGDCNMKTVDEALRSNQSTELRTHLDEASCYLQSTGNIIPSTGECNMKTVDEALHSNQSTGDRICATEDFDMTRLDARLDALRTELRTYLDEAVHSIQPEGNIIPSMGDVDVKTLDARFDALRTELRTYLDEAVHSIQPKGNIMSSMGDLNVKTLDARFDALRTEFRTYLDEAVHSIQPKGNIMPSMGDLCENAGRPV